MTRIAIIGTAGRDKTKPLTLAHWLWMIRDVRMRVPHNAHVVSGGAAWVDHLAVNLFLFGWVGEISLHLPAPFAVHQFMDMGFKSAGGAANYYHRQFSQVIGRDTLGQIFDVIQRHGIDDGVHVTEEAASPGIGGMFARNAKVAQADEVLAYTFGEGDVPADGGTKHTWDRCQGQKTHITIPLFL